MYSLLSHTTLRKFILLKVYVTSLELQRYMKRLRASKISDNKVNNGLSLSIQQLQ